MNACSSLPVTSTLFFHLLIFFFLFIYIYGFIYFYLFFDMFLDVNPGKIVIIDFWHTRFSSLLTSLSLSLLSSSHFLLSLSLSLPFLLLLRTYVSQRCLECVDGLDSLETISNREIIEKHVIFIAVNMVDQFERAQFVPLLPLSLPFSPPLPSPLLLLPLSS